MDTVILRLVDTDLRVFARELLAEHLMLPRVPTRPWQLPQRDKRLSSRDGVTPLIVNHQALLVGWWKWDGRGDIMHVGWHCSHFPSWDSMLAWLRKTFGALMPVVMAQPLVRLDMCVDILVPHEELWRSVYLEKANRVQLITREWTTVYLGSPKRKQTYVYPVDHAEVWGWDWTRPYLPLHQRYVGGSRIESRLLRDALPIETLEDVEDLIDFEPFKRLRATSADLAETASSLTPLKRFELYGVLEYRRQFGIAAARRAYASASKGNYQRNIGRHLKAYDLPDLDKVFQGRMAKFLGDGLDNGISTPRATEKSAPGPEVTQ